MSPPGLESHDKWPTTLKHFHLFIQGLPHPAAIYWTDQLIFLCNDAWARHGDAAIRSGMPQGPRLDRGAREAMLGAMENKKPVRVNPKHLISADLPTGVRALVTHIPEFESDAINGVLVQLLPKTSDDDDEDDDTLQIPMGDHQKTTEENQAEGAGLGLAKSHGGTSNPAGLVNDTPLDENPLFKRFAAMLPTGLAILNQDAEAIFVNPQFHELTVHEDKDKSFKAWPHTIHSEDYKRVMKAYKSAFSKQEPLRIEFRAQGQGEPWRLLLLSPLKEDTLHQSSLQRYGGFICAIIDITSNKSAEITEREAAREASERKERQERFVDMISHEIRNPLSAVLHCAEDVLEVATTNLDGDAKSELVEAAETIQLCVAHQRTIVDEVLSFSKLDASLLTLVPKATQPRKHFVNTLKMFHPEMRKREIEFKFQVDDSYDSINVRWVNADLKRMAQVLVNLITNAIKFTAKKDGKKDITVAIGASRERPKSYPPNVVFFNTEEKSFKMDGTNKDEWGSGESLHIMVAVIDTGIGISEEMQKKLFQRFHQAMPRTEQSYGGSGLGLNISRKLCHLHGGEVGVKSQEGEGSTFGFFFKVRRTAVRSENSTSSGQETMASAELEYQLHRLDQDPDEASSEGTVHDKDGINVSHDEDLPKADTTRLQHEVDKLPKTDSGPGVKADNQTKLVLLLVEDNSINARIVRRKLQSKGFDVRTAVNGQEAVDATTAVSGSPPQCAFDVVLMDQEMPVMNGSAASTAIRKWEHQMQKQHRIDHFHVPILGVSANVRDVQKDSMLSAGMDDVIGKPYKFEELIVKIQKLMADSRRR